MTSSGRRPPRSPPAAPATQAEFRNALAAFCAHDGTQFSEGDVRCRSCGAERGLVRVSNVGWQRQLWRRQAFPDNYIDPSFLQSLRKNAHVRVFDLASIIAGSVSVLQQLCTTAQFAIVFHFLYVGELAVNGLLLIDLLLLIIGSAIMMIVSPLSQAVWRQAAFLPAAKSLTLFFLSCLALSPILRTLTEPFSNDTVWTLTILLLLVHISFTDYRYLNAITTSMVAPISVNAAIFASVLLASRLSSVLHVFGYVSFAVELFTLFPVARHYLLRHAGQWYHNLLTGVMALLTAVQLMWLSHVLLAVFLTSSVVIVIAAPLGLLWAQQYKDEISGPWDEAVPSTTRRPVSMVAKQPRLTR